jgi:tripartite ATP-independent transporter DctP family solute receptor
MRPTAPPIIAALLMLASAASPGVAQAQFRERTIRISAGVSKAHPLGLGMQKMAQCVGEKSAGRMKLQTYFDSSLGNDTTASNAVRAGSLDMVLTSTAPLVGTIPQLAVFDLPFLFGNEKEADQVLDGKAGDFFAPRFAAAGFVNLSYWENGFRSVTNSKRPVTKWEDLQGVKLRVMQNKVYIDTFTTLGTNPVPMAFSEVYLALETKAIDGQENPVLLIDDLKFQEVQKYLSLTRHAYSPAPVLYSKKLFDQLSADEQDALRECSKVGRDSARTLGRTLEAKTLESLKKQGMQVNEISPAELQRMRERVKPVYEVQARTIGDETMNVVLGELQRIRGK